MRRVPALAHIALGPRDVRFAPESTRPSALASCPLCAKSRHSVLRHKSRYSITSSAMASTGTVAAVSGRPPE
jgi:hypothetical protein